MIIMDRQEHIHIISSGENIHNTYHLAISNNQITRTYVIVEEEICKISPKDDAARKERKRKDPGCYPRSEIHLRKN